MFNKPSWHFGSGRLMFRKDGGTPISVATLQGVDIDISASTKELMGANQYAEATARTGGKITGKVQSGRFDHRIVTELFFGAMADDVSTGLVVPVDRLPVIVPDGVLVVAENGEFDMDLGVVLEATGQAFRRSFEAELQAGEYAVDETEGSYRFAAADAGKKVLLSYLMVDTTRGQTTIITNPLMGEAPTFELVSFDAKGLFLQLYACQFSKLSLQRKNEDFLIPNLEFSAVADEVRGVGRISGV